jgi:hypothetical protein
VVAYRAALEERTRERVPLDWAMTQNNLGSALRSLGEREHRAERTKKKEAGRAAPSDDGENEQTGGKTVPVLQVGRASARIVPQSMPRRLHGVRTRKCSGCPARANGTEI